MRISDWSSDVCSSDLFEAAGAPAGDLLTPEDYAACRVTPVPVNDPDKGLPNLEGLGQALKDYAAALFVLTDAEDEAALEQAFGPLHASPPSLLATVNGHMAARREPPLPSTGAPALGNAVGRQSVCPSG